MALARRRVSALARLLGPGHGVGLDHGVGPVAAATGASLIGARRRLRAMPTLAGVVVAGTRCEGRANPYPRCRGDGARLGGAPRGAARTEGLARRPIEEAIQRAARLAGASSTGVSLAEA